MIIGFGHQGGSYGTMPAGWTLIEQNVSPGGTTRGELYWKRANNEPASYTIAGLGSPAVGSISAYSGGLATGTPVEASASRGNVTVTTSPESGAPSITSLSERTLLLQMVVNEGAFAATNFAHLSPTGTLDDVDLNTTSGQPQMKRSNTIHYGLSHMLHRAIGPTGDAAPQCPAAAENVVIHAVLAAQPTTPVGTRYYFTLRTPPARLKARLHGSWDVGASSPHPGGGLNPTYRRMLSKFKAGGGAVEQVLNYVTNQDPNYDMCMAWYTSPPLARQTIAGTVDLVYLTSKWFQDNILGAVNTATVRLKVHIYIAKGQTTDVRAVLLNRYLDPTQMPFAFIPTVTAMTQATLTSGQTEEGDTLIVELGWRNEDCPSPYPLYPPDDFTIISTSTAGTADNVSTAGGNNGVPYEDAEVGVSTSLYPKQVSYLQFSADIKELPAAALPAIPAHYVSTAPVVLSGELPLSHACDTSRVPSTRRHVFYEWTADRDGLMYVTNRGSNYAATIEVYSDLATLTTAPGRGIDSTYQLNGGRCYTNFTAVEGTTYTFVARTEAFPKVTAGDAGGLLRIELWPWRLPALDDIYVPNIPSMGFDDCGNPFSVDTQWDVYVPTSFAIDYSRTPMDDYNFFGGPQTTNERILVGMFSNGIVEFLDLATWNIGGSEVDFFFPYEALDPNDPDNEHPAWLALDGQGRCLVAWFGDGFQHTSGLYIPPSPPSLVAFYNNKASDPMITSLRRIQNIWTDGFGQGGPDSGRKAEAFVLPVERLLAVQAIALDPDDDEVVYYTCAANYTPKTFIAGLTEDLRAAQVKRYSLLTRQPLADVVTVPLRPGPNPGLKGLAIVPDGHGVLVCNGNEVQWYSLDGALIRRYVTHVEGEGGSLYSVQLTSDAKFLWAYDQELAVLYQWELLSGTLVRTVETWLTPGDGSQIVLYQPNGIQRCW
jgi:hypothetical protein